MYRALAIKIVKQLVLAVLDTIAIAAYDPTAYVFLPLPLQLGRIAYSQLRPFSVSAVTGPSTSTMP